MATTGTPRRPSAPDGGSRGPTQQPNRKNGNGGGRPPSRTNGAGRRRPKRPSIWYKIKTFFLFVTLLVLVMLATVIITVGTMLNKAPSKIDLTFAPLGRTLIYSSDGVLLAKIFTQNRQVVPIERIPNDLQNATVAFEDKRFYTHTGIDYQGIVRAIIRNIKSHDMKGEGGSTITQQLARNMGVEGLNNKKSMQRKFHEWIVANQIEKKYTKQQILEMYLNQVNYGSGAYGVQAAAQTYFGKDVHDLDLAQCAMLAGLPNRPAFYNPYKDKKNAELQRNRVLDEMVQQGKITPAQYTKAKGEYIHLASATPPSKGNQIAHAPYFVNYVVEQLKVKYGEDYVLRGNLQVTTTLNWPMQQAAEEAVRHEIANAGAGGPTQACLVAIDPKNGEIKAMVGGADYKKSQFNIVTQSRRQPGSLFKAIVYSAAIDSGVVNEYTPVLDARTTFKLPSGSWTPQDDTRYKNYRVTLKEALAQSINVPAVKVLDLIKPSAAIHYAKLMGIDSDLPDVLSLALGSCTVTPLEITSAYCTFPAGGDHPIPMSFSLITDSDGKTIENITPAVTTRVLQDSTVKQLDDMLLAVVNDPGGTGQAVKVVPNAHGKTGTTQNHKDVWFVGYTPELVCGVWAGRPHHDRKTGADSYGEEMRGNAWGATICAPIWRDFMLKGVPILKDVKARIAARTAPKPTATTTGSTTGGTTGGDTDVVEEGGRRRRHKGDADNPANYAPPVAQHNADHTVTVNVDDNTGMLAPDNAPHSSRITFAEGSEPTEMSPEYVRKPSPTPTSTTGGPAPAPQGAAPNTPTPDSPNSAPPDNPATPVTGPSSPTAQPPAHARIPVTAPPATPQPASTPQTSPAQNAGAPSSTADNSTAADQPPVQRRTRRRAARNTGPTHPATITVRINPEDGLLATEWCPQVIDKTYPWGQQPRRHSTMYKPPPGEH